METQNGPNMMRISRSIKTTPGKQIETKRVLDYGVGTIPVIEHGETKSKTVDG